MNDLSTSITQLESNNVNVQPSPPSRENLLRCQSCLKVFETMAGYMHHKEANEMCHFDEGETHVEAWENQLLKEWAIVLKKKLFFTKCNVCNEIVMSTSCTQCQRNPLKFSRQNDCHPTEIPDVMRGIPHYLAGAISRINTVKPVLERRNSFRGKVILISEFRYLIKIFDINKS